MQIAQLSEHLGQEVILKGWVSNKRKGKGLAFLLLRDGSGFTQCVVDANNVSDKNMELALDLSLESAVIVKGSVVKDDRQVGGYELSVKEIELFSYVSLCLFIDISFCYANLTIYAQKKTL